MNQIIRIKCVLLGNANAGKSSMVFRYTKNEFINKCQTTVGCSFNSKELELEDKIIKLDIWDTAGQEKYRSLLPLYYRKAKLVLLCFDLSVYDTNLKKLCPTTIAHTVKKLLLITDIIAHILVKNEHTFFRMKDENDTLAFAVLLMKCICVDVLNDVEKII